MSARRPALVLRVPSRTEFLATVRDVTRHLAQGAGLDGAHADQLALAVDEAATNVIEHAYHGAASVPRGYTPGNRRPSAVADSGAPD